MLFITLCEVMERHDTAVTHGIQSLRKEIVVDGFSGRASAEKSRSAETPRRTRLGNVTERNVGHRQVEIIVERSFHFLKPQVRIFWSGRGMPQRLYREQIAFSAIHIRIGAVP